MRHSYDVQMGRLLFVPASEETCTACDHGLRICEHRIRFVQRSDELYQIVRQIKWCANEDCPDFHKTYCPLVDLRLALPWITYGTDVILELGERHLAHNTSLSAIGRDFTARGVPMSQRETSFLFRAYVALTKAARGDDEQVRARLRAQGGIVVMADGVQFDANSPVLYLVWDALSGEVLFGERKLFRGEDDLVPLLERVKAMDIPIIAAVSDKETGLLPAMARVFPDAPHQLCQLHFLKNCALGMERDLRELGESVASRADKAQKIAKRLHTKGFNSIESEQSVVSSPVASASANVATSVPPGPDGAAVETAAQPAALSEEQLAVELCAMARHASRASGRAPLNPPELVRHERLEAVRTAVQAAKKKEGDHPILDRLDDALTPDWHGARAAGRAERHVDILRDVAHEITPDPKRPDPPANGDEAHERLRKKLQVLQDEAPRTGLGAATGDFIDHVVGVATRYGRKLFHCYDDPRIPATSNGLEGLFGVSKAQLRGALGEASTANGVAQNLGADYLAALVFTRAHTRADLLAALSSLSASDYEAARESIQGTEHFATLRRSRRRQPERHLRQLVGAWLFGPEARGS